MKRLKPVMRLRPTLLVLLALIPAFAAGPARAIQSGDPAALVSSLVNEAISNIKDTQASQSSREEKFRSLLESGFDIPRISRFVMGRYWTSASDQERRQFSSLFEDWIVRTYAARFKQYSGQAIQVTGTRTEGETGTVVLSQFVDPNGAPPAKVEWRVRKDPSAGYKVIDVSVEGVSMALTQRDEIAAVADRSGGTVQSLNSALQQKIQSGAPAPGGPPAPSPGG